MDRHPLMTHASGDSVVAWRGGGAAPVTRSQFVADVMALAARLPGGQHLLNLCGDRYRFGVGLAAAMVCGKKSLLPPTHTPGVLRQIQDYAPDVFCLTDNPACDVALPLVNVPAGPAAASVDHPMPQVDASQCVAVVFTSGSTGEPKPNPKHWGALAGCVKAEAQCLGLAPGVLYGIVGTVPPQHMYGFESTLLMAWQNGFAHSHAHPFFPADIVAALAAIPAPRVLVSSPVHLRAMLDAGVRPPDIALVVSATAPLSAELAREVESRYNTRLMEIYGSTETGQVASRRTTATSVWDLFPGVTFSRAPDEAGRTQASGGHVLQPVLMSDLIEPIDASRFLLHGRLSDMINIAGKRHSLASLNHLLTHIPGVMDGAFYMPESGDAVAPRLAACVVAPGLDAPRIMAALSEHLDPVFLPRPLLFLNALPRNNTGKLPREALTELFQNHATRN